MVSTKIFVGVGDCRDVELDAGVIVADLETVDIDSVETNIGVVVSKVIIDLGSSVDFEIDTALVDVNEDSEKVNVDIVGASKIAG